MKTNNFFLLILMAPVLVFAGVAFSQGLADVQYPVQELGGCKDTEACKLYCDKPGNIDACMSFAQKNDLMSKQEIKIAKEFAKGEMQGPGGCTTRDACDEYCNDMNHIDECIAFAEKNDIIPREELAEAKKVQAAIKRGIKPPSCGSKKSCDAYCESPEHMEECINFAVEAGFMQGKELEDSQKMLQAIRRGVKPPPCKGKEACDEYCSNPDNMETCMNFAIEAGFMSEEEKANSQKMMQALKKGVKPPPCKGKEACDEYCGSQEHMEECINFSVAAGMMSEKEAEMAKKTKGKGPGGCKGKEECKTFCNNPDNQETCFNFAKENGMIPEEDLKRMEEGKQQMKQSIEQAPAEVIECLQTEFGADMVEKMKDGFMPPRELGEKMGSCFGKMGPPDNQQGPNSCEGEECQKFAPGPGVINPGGQMMPQQAGPGGCKTPEECQSFCQTNPEQCKNFQQQPMPPGQPCQGENCQPPPQDMRQYQPPQTGENPAPCQGENCQYPPPPAQPGEQQPPPSTEPGAGGSIPIGEPVPQAAPVEQTAPNEPPPPPPSEPTSFLINPDSFVASAAAALFKLILRY